MSKMWREKLRKAITRTARGQLFVLCSSFTDIKDLRFKYNELATIYIEIVPSSLGLFKFSKCYYNVINIHLVIMLFV